MPSVPWTRVARPVACGRQAGYPRLPAKAERRLPEFHLFQHEHYSGPTCDRANFRFSPKGI